MKADVGSIYIMHVTGGKERAQDRYLAEAHPVSLDAAQHSRIAVDDFRKRCLVLCSSADNVGDWL